MAVMFFNSAIRLNVLAMIAMQYTNICIFNAQFKFLQILESFLRPIQHVNQTCVKHDMLDSGISELDWTSVVD
jgi:hypothetical protein